MVAVVDDADTFVGGTADGSHAGVTAAATVVLGYLSIGVMQEGVANMVDMLVVILAIVAATGTVVTDTHALVGPCGISHDIALVIDDLVHLNIGVGGIGN